MNKTFNLTDWFWSEVKKIEKKEYDRSQEREITSYSMGREICQCATETLIKNSRNPGKMRSIMLICFLIPVFLGATQDRYNLAVQPILYLFGVKAINSVWYRLRWLSAVVWRPRA